jgi:heme iron utilization protein
MVKLSATTQPREDQWAFRGHHCEVNVATGYRFSKKTANSQDNSMTSGKAEAAFSAPATARATLAAAGTGTLATLMPDGAPFASFVLVATDENGDIVLLMSKLARHTNNLAADRRASLLVVAEGGERGDPLAGARITFNGSVDEKVTASGQAQFLARHPEAARYAGFGDFQFRRLRISSAHLVAGFGRIAELVRGDLLEASEDG